MDRPSRTVNPTCVRHHIVHASKGLGENKRHTTRLFCQKTQERTAVKGQLEKPTLKYKSSFFTFFVVVLFLFLGVCCCCCCLFVLFCFVFCCCCFCFLVEANSKPHGIVIYTDGSVTRDRSGWAFTVARGKDCTRRQ